MTTQSIGLRTDINLFALEVETARRSSQTAEGVAPDPHWDLRALCFSSRSRRSHREQLAHVTAVLVPFDGSPAGPPPRAAGGAATIRSDVSAGAREAGSRDRAAYESVRRSERCAEHADAAPQALQVLEITNISFRAGATTNIEVIDAQRGSRDADTAVAAPKTRSARRGWTC